MLIESTKSSNRINFLTHKYNELVSCGIKPENVLIIALNSYKKALFPNGANVYTFQGLCYNAFLDNREYISNLINDTQPEIKPNLCGLEISQFIFKQSIKEADFSDYISKINLLHQLFRRYSLIVQNSLSNKEVLERSIFLKEEFRIDAQKAIDDYKLKTIQYKSFDYLRQMAILPLICQNTGYFRNIEYLFIDDADELSYAFWQFTDYLMPQLKDCFIAYDKDGSSRCGYLCAYKSGIKEFKKKYNPEEILIETKPNLYEKAQEFFINLRKGNKTKFKADELYSGVNRLDMIDAVKKQVKELMASGVKANEITIISPAIDNVLIQSLAPVNIQVISGSEKLADIPEIKYILTILKIVNGIEIQNYEIKNILINLLKIPYKKCLNIINAKDFTQINLNNDKYNKLISVINSLKKCRYSLSEQIKIIWENLIRENQKKYEFLLKEASSFEYAFKDRIDNILEQFLIQIENSVISENPAEIISINNNAILLGTPQKIIDYAIQSKYQLWLDISNSEWLKEDRGTLYNAWGFSRDFAKKEFTLEYNIKLTRDKAARIIRKLMLGAEKQVKMYSSLYDNLGNENFGGLAEYIETEQEEKKQEFKIIPRDDQKPVLEYKTGKMGIMAVPGAGKTTILLALITKLIKEGTKPSNIFVLTYMESAAKNFKERIKAILPEQVETPNISTIHGLALRIIKENANYTKIGLDENFEICDDNTKEKLVRELLNDDEKFDNYIRCLSIVKLSGKENLTSKHKDIQEFFDFYKKYNDSLKAHNMIDYDDMLYYAVKILKENDDVLNYYKNLCKYIIEDEAQDSSEIQQRLLNILSSKYNNIVRCGDINQAITSTFTNSDTEGFKIFLNRNKKVEMNSSQRCAEPIYTLANNLIKTTLTNEELKNAFYEIEMKGTDKNPKTEDKPIFMLFEEEDEEKAFILKEIKKILKDNPKASIALLLRLNSQVNEFGEYFMQNGITTSMRTDCLAQKKIFKKIIAVLKIIQTPLNNKTILELAQYYTNNNKDIEFLKNLKEPFINLSPDNFTSEKLIQLYWDIDYLLNQSTSSVEDTALKAGIFYSETEADKANTYLISTFIKKFGSDINQLEYIAARPLSTYKFFEDKNINDENKINIMTMHKSKGDEFDYVFIAQMNEENYPLKKDNVKLKSGGHFVQTIKAITEGSTAKMPDVLKQEQVYETLRLIYVGITRAKLKLYITGSKMNKRHKKLKTSYLFEQNIY